MLWVSQITVYRVCIFEKNNRFSLVFYFDLTPCCNIYDNIVILFQDQL